MKVQSHDPYRGHAAVQIPTLGEVPYDGPVVIHAHVDRYPPFVNAGAEWMLHAMLRACVDAGMEAHVTTAVPDPVEVDGVKVWPAHYAEAVAAGAHVLVGHLLWTREVVTLAHRQRLPLLYISHNDFQVRYWKLGPNDVTALVHNAEWIAERHTEQFPHWKGPSITVRPPCRMVDYHVRRNAKADLIALVNPNPDKGAAVFYEVARRMPERKFLTVGGAYGQQQQIPAGLRNVIHQPATGAIAHDVYRRTRLLMVPSKYESWGRVAVEAMCSGIPVLAQPTPGLVESCGDAGIYCDRDDPASWVAAITALDDPAAYQARSGAALERAILLDKAADRDLAGWVRLVRRAAGVSVASRA